MRGEGNPAAATAKPPHLTATAQLVDWVSVLACLSCQRTLVIALVVDYEQLAEVVKNQWYLEVPWGRAEARAESDLKAKAYGSAQAV